MITSIGHLSWLHYPNILLGLIALRYLFTFEVGLGCVVLELLLILLNIVGLLVVVLHQLLPLPIIDALLYMERQRQVPRVILTDRTVVGPHVIEECLLVT